MIRFILSLLLFFAVMIPVVSISGCAKAIAIEEKIADEITAIDAKTHGVLRILTKTGQTLHYVSELHKAGVDTDVIHAIEKALSDAHTIAEREHFKIRKE